MKLLDSLFGKPADTNDPPYYESLRRSDFVTALPLLRAAIRRDDARAMALFATLLAFGRGVDTNLQDAADWFRQSAVRGHIAGQAAYGACLASGLGVARNDHEAAYWLYRAGCGGCRHAIEILSDVVLRNQRVVGAHFSMKEFLHLMRWARRPAGAGLH